MFPQAIMVQTVSDLRRQELLVRTERERRANEAACPPPQWHHLAVCALALAAVALGPRV